MSDKIDISEIGKPELLAALYNASQPVGLGFLQATPQRMEYREAEIIIEQQGKSFDYLKGRPLKIDISGNSFDPRGYDRDNGGTGSAARVVQAVRDGVELKSKSAAEMGKGIDAFLAASSPEGTMGVAKDGPFEGWNVMTLGLDPELREALEKSRGKFNGPKTGEGGP